MGFKTIGVYAALGVAAVLLEVTGLFLAQTKVWFWTLAGTAKLFVLEIKVLQWKIPAGGSDLCNIPGSEQVQKAIGYLGGANFCKEAIEGDLQTATQRLCSFGIQQLAPTMCTAFENGFPLGFMLMSVVILNCVLVLISCGLLFIYISSPTPKQAYRHNAVILLGLSTLIIIGGIIVYFMFFLWPMCQDHTGLLGPLSGLVLSANGSMGYSIGFFLICVGAVVQMVMVFVGGSFVASGKELTKDELLDMKEQQKLEALEGQSYGTSSFGAPQYQQAPPMMVQQPVMVPQSAMFAQPVYGAAPQAVPTAAW